MSIIKWTRKKVIQNNPRTFSKNPPNFTQFFRVFLHFFVIFMWNYITVPNFRHVTAQMKNSCNHFLIWNKTFQSTWPRGHFRNPPPCGHSWSFHEPPSPSTDHMVYGCPLMFCECYGSNFIIIMPPRTQYLPVAGNLPEGWREDCASRACPRVYLIQKNEILNFLETFMSHPGKSLKVYFNLFLRILAYEMKKKSRKIFLSKAKISGN